MPRLLVILLLMLWLAYEPAGESSTGLWGLPVWLLGYVLLVLGLGLWSRRLAASGQGRMGAFFRAALIGRVAVPVWFGVGLLLWGWGDVVHRGGSAIGLGQVHSVLLVIGTLPAMGAWMALWWAVYPAERALRERRMLGELDAGFPVLAVPEFSEYFRANFRLQLLATMAPVLCIIVLRDAAAAVGRATGWSLTAGQEQAVLLGSALLVFVLAPWILRHVLDTVPLPEGTLRQGLVAIARRWKVRLGDLLLWRTNGLMANAAVMGVVPPVRYVLLSDVLLDTLNREQVEVVFAHELGHAVHSHLPWYGVAIAAFVMAADPLAAWVGRHMEPLLGMTPTVVLGLLLLFGAFFLLFGWLSRHFERQADVFAARLVSTPGIDRLGPITPAGAALFGGALLRVAGVNHMRPVVAARAPGLRGALVAILRSARDWLHGTMESRIDYLHRLAGDERGLRRFDAAMLRVRLILLAMLAAAIGYTLMDVLR